MRAGRDARRAGMALPVVVALILAGAYLAIRRPDRQALPALPTLPADAWLLDLPAPVFADADHGFLLLGRCPTTTCETWVAATHDAGRTWDGAIVPGLTFPSEAEPPRAARCTRSTPPTR